MRTFVRIVEAGSLSAAARQLATTCATVSRRLQSLETMLGVRLLLRTTHTTRLTDDGERCYQHARRVIDSWLALEDEVGQTEDEPVGVLRVRAPHAFGQDQLLKPVTEFLQRYPQLSIEWMLNDRSADFLGDNLDCAIRVGVEVDPATVSVLLAEVPRSVVASPALLARFPAVNTPEDLQQFPRIAISSSTSATWSFFTMPRPPPRGLLLRHGSAPTACMSHAIRHLPALAWPWYPAGRYRTIFGKGGWCICCPSGSPRRYRYIWSIHGPVIIQHACGDFWS